MINGISQKPRGVVLIMILGMLAIFSFIVVHFLELASRTVRQKGAAEAKQILRETAYSVLNITLATLNEFAVIDRGLLSPLQGWGDPLLYASLPLPEGVHARVVLVDETGKWPIQNPSSEVLTVFFNQMGLPSTRVSLLTDSLLDWISPLDPAGGSKRLNGADARYYEQLSPPYRPPGRPLKTYRELEYVRGFGDIFYHQGQRTALGDLFEANTSLHSGGGEKNVLNINTASLFTLQVLEQYDHLDITPLRSFVDNRERALAKKIESHQLRTGPFIRPEEGSRYLSTQAMSKAPLTPIFNCEVLKVTIETEWADFKYLLSGILLISVKEENAVAFNWKTLIENTWLD